MAKEVIVSADRVKKRKRFGRIVKLSLLAILVFLMALYAVLSIIYGAGKFTVSLDSNRTFKSGLVIYDDPTDPFAKRKLEADSIKFMDNISFKTLPDASELDADGIVGGHNGENHIAYTFYIENQKDLDLNYWYELDVDEVIKNVDEAIRIRIYHNGKATTYAKRSSLDNEPEDGTVPFKNIPDAEDTIILEKDNILKPDQRDRITIVVWLEGDDPECTDPLIGGELKMHMIIGGNQVESKEEWKNEKEKNK